MASRVKPILLLLVIVLVVRDSTLANPDKEIKERIVTAPYKNSESNVIDGTGTEAGFHGSNDRKVVSGRVSVSTVAWFTLAMAAATGLGAVPFFFVELEPQWAGVCNGMAGGVMLAASFDLVQEGQVYGSGSWVVIGILSGGIFILLCKKVTSLVTLTDFFFMYF